MLFTEKYTYVHLTVGFVTIIIKLYRLKEIAEYNYKQVFPVPEIWSKLQIVPHRYKS
jgi:hypothetical protein